MHVKATHLLCNPVRIAMLGVTEYKSAICQSLNNILRKINQPGSNKSGCRQLTNLRRSLHIGHPQGWSWLLLFIHTVHVGLLVYFCPCPPSLPWRLHDLVICDYDREGAHRISIMRNNVNKSADSSYVRGAWLVEILFFAIRGPDANIDLTRTLPSASNKSGQIPRK